LLSDGYTVQLVTSAHTESQSYTITVTNVQDLGGHAMSSSPATYTAADGFFDDFESGTMSLWTPSASTNWEVKDTLGSKWLHCKTYTGDKLVESKSFTTMTMTADIRGVGNTYRNSCLIFGYQDANNYYYAEMAGQSDKSGIYKVTAGVSRQLMGLGVGAVLADNTVTHKVTLTVDVSNGSIKAYYDGVVMFTLVDNTYTGGKVGVWVNTRMGYFDNVRVVRFLQAPVTGITDRPVQLSDAAAYLELSPNPGYNQIVVKYIAKLSEGPALVRIYNNAGQQVFSATVQNQMVGGNQFVWDRVGNDGQRVKAGVYMVELVKQRQSITRKLMLAD
jgi:hypothetical protein